MPISLQLDLLARRRHGELEAARRRVTLLHVVSQQDYVIIERPGVN